MSFLKYSQKSYKFLLLIILCFSSKTHTQTATPETLSPEAETSRNYLTFRHNDTDKYYTGWLNPRAFISRFYINHNPDLKNAFLTRNPSSADAWNLDGITALLEARIATELYLARFPLWGVGIGGALDIPLLGRNKPATLNVYGVMGQIAIFVDVFLPYDMKLRIIPLFHESTHLADGYKGDSSDFSYISYEFISIELYKKFRDFTFYGGVEITYNAPSERLLRTRIQFGTDYRYPIWKKINFILGINIAALYDEKVSRHPESEGWHPAINFGTGIEFDRYIIALKVSHQRGFEAATYHYMQTHVGLEFSVTF